MFNQAFDYQGFDDSLQGGRGFLSYGDRFGDLSLYTAYSHLDNDSQPMDYLFNANSAPNGTETAVSGMRQETDKYGNPVAYFGNTGSLQSSTDQFKTKVGYEFDDWLAIATVAYEERNIVRDSIQNYLVSDTGETVWSGRVVDDGIAFNVASSDFTVSEQNRRSLLLGARVQGKMTEQWWLEASVSDFRILEDESRGSLANPLDPAYSLNGTVSAYDDTGWKTANAKLQNDSLFGNKSLGLVFGYDYEQYSLGIDNFTSTNYVNGDRTAASNLSGGETDIKAVYAQLGWNLNERWDVGLGGRYETWGSANGFYYDYARNSLQDHPDRRENRFSPKFTLGYAPDDAWQFRYSLARAYRFPIVEELFQNERRTTGTSIANANLEPEDGLHQNLSIERSIDGGYVRFNVFGETIKDVIFNQTAIVDNRAITTFLPVDEVRTRGTEFVINRSDFASQLDLRFNVAYVDSEITENSANPALEGNAFPRMPSWRSNLLGTWHVTEKWDLGGGIRYASDNYGDLDNSDTAHGVFGAQDAYTQISLKTSYSMTDNLRLSFGIDNLTNEIAFVHHPWPGRTVYLEAGLDL